MKLVCPGIKLISLIYQHIAILVRLYTQFIFVFSVTVLILAHELSLTGHSAGTLDLLTHWDFSLLLHTIYLFFILILFILHMNVVWSGIK